LTHSGTDILTVKSNNLEILDWPPVTPEAWKISTRLASGERVFANLSASETEQIHCYIAAKTMGKQFYETVITLVFKNWGWFLATAKLQSLELTGPSSEWRLRHPPSLGIQSHFDTPEASEYIDKTAFGIVSLMRTRQHQ